MFGFFDRRQEQDALAGSGSDLRSFLEGFSIEVMPRTAAKVENFRDLLPSGTRVYIAHIEGTPIDDMVSTATRLSADGFDVMPHIPARLIRDAGELETWVGRYREEAGVDQALLLAGGAAQPAGDLTSSIDMMETGVFERHAFRRLHVAGHPEGNRDIDPDGSSTRTDEALAWKQAWAERTGCAMAITTQFAFDAAPIIGWAEHLAGQGIRLPIHVGVAGPAKLQTLIKYAMACGVGPSIKVLQRRALDMRKLLMPYEPDEVVAALAAYKSEHPQSLIAKVHLFPLGGIKASAEWAAENGGAREERVAAE
ncbi:methylenetetrahydrofolate reductase [Aquibium sp. LZ166]|uniref:Methylenetetrahydrofolate reductase n=1 Tax=Aquibium pacificus TaxID=3153579 RepID=A0ABV3SQ87_9HYPH